MTASAETQAARAGRLAGRRAAFASLAAAVLALGIADSMVGSYAVLFAADQAGMTPLQVGIFASAPSVGGIVVSWLLGRRFDRRPTRRYVPVVTLLGALGLVLMTFTTSFPVLILLALTLLGGVAAAFPQLFALAQLLTGDGAAGQRVGEQTAGYCHRVCLTQDWRP